MKYLILMYGSQQDYDAMAGNAGPGEPAWSAADFAALGAFMGKWNNELIESGEFVDAQGLAAPVHTRRIGMTNGASYVTDGPYPETAEVLAGYTIVDCESFDRATEIAGRIADCPIPASAAADAYVEVRPIAGGPPEFNEV